MDVVLGMSMAPTAVRMVLVEGENADGVTVGDDNFVIVGDDDAATISAADRVISTIVSTREGATQAGYALASTGVTWTDPVEAATLREALAARKVENVMLVSAFMAAAALAQMVGTATGNAHTALLFVERETATLAVVDSADGSITDVHKGRISSTDSVAELAELLAGLDTLETHPQHVFVVGSGVDVTALKPQLEAMTSLPVSAPEEPETALAWGAALASANTPLFASSTAALACAQDPVTGAIDPYAVSPGHLAVPNVPPGTELGEEDLAYSADPDEEAEAETTVLDLADEPRERRPLLLVGTIMAVVFVAAALALEVSLALGIRPSAVALLPRPLQNLLVPTPAPSPAPIPASAPEPLINHAAVPAVTPRAVNAPIAAPPPAAPVLPPPPAAPPVAAAPPAPVVAPHFPVLVPLPLPIPVGPPASPFPANLPGSPPWWHLPGSPPPGSLPPGSLPPGHSLGSPPPGSPPPVHWPGSPPPGHSLGSPPPGHLPWSPPPVSVPSEPVPVHLPAPQPPVHVPAPQNPVEVSGPQLPIPMPAPDSPIHMPAPEAPVMPALPVPEAPMGPAMPAPEAPLAPAMPAHEAPPAISQGPQFGAPPVQGPSDDSASHGFGGFGGNHDSGGGLGGFGGGDHDSGGGLGGFGGFGGGHSFGGGGFGGGGFGGGGFGGGPLRGGGPQLRRRRRAPLKFGSYAIGG